MLKKEYVYKEFLRKEDDILRAPYTPELAFYSLIRSGDTEQVRRICQESFIDKQGFGKLSENPLRNIRYHFIITIALIARYCIDGGLDVSTSYGLSDFYIQKVDTCTTPEEISELHFTAVMDYTNRMKKLRKEKICSQQIAKCIDYIHDNLHTRITVETLSNHVGLNPSYLSRLFKKETGCSVSEYIRNLKIDAAKNMLIYSEFSPSEIASILAFSDQSHFTETFRKCTGVTPRKFQTLHLREMTLHVPTEPVSH